MQGPASPNPAATGGTLGRRSAARLRLALRARLITLRGHHPCLLFDLSRTGARIGLSERLEEDDNGILLVGPLEAFGTVVRRIRGFGRDGLGTIVGLHFDEPLADADVLAVRRHAETCEHSERNALREEVRLWVTGGR